MYCTPKKIALDHPFHQISADGPVASSPMTYCPPWSNDRSQTHCSGRKRNISVKINPSWQYKCFDKNGVWFSSEGKWVSQQGAGYQSSFIRFSVINQKNIQDSGGLKRLRWNDEKQCHLLYLPNYLEQLLFGKQSKRTINAEVSAFLPVFFKNPKTVFFLHHLSAFVQWIRICLEHCMRKHSPLIWVH